jgi:hypothetical protein
VWVWIAAAVIGASIHAGHKPEYAAKGVGMSLCSGFNEINSHNPKWARLAYFSWAEGFMAGANSARNKHKQGAVVVNAKSDNEEWRLLKDRCASHPTERFAVGVMILYLSLPRQPPEK